MDEDVHETQLTAKDLIARGAECYQPFLERGKGHPLWNVWAFRFYGNTWTGNSSHMKGLALFSQVRDVGIFELKETNAALKGMEDWKEIRFLRLWGGDVNDQSLAIAKNFPQLIYFDIKSAGISNSGIRLLAKHQSLRILSLDHCNKITSEGIAQLRVANKLVKVYQFDTSQRPVVGTIPPPPDSLWLKDNFDEVVRSLK